MSFLTTLKRSRQLKILYIINIDGKYVDDLFRFGLFRFLGRDKCWCVSFPFSPIYVAHLCFSQDHTKTADSPIVRECCVRNRIRCPECKWERVWKISLKFVGRTIDNIGDHFTKASTSTESIFGNSLMAPIFQMHASFQCLLFVFRFSLISFQFICSKFI